jgi:hypothetical protein
MTPMKKYFFNSNEADLILRSCTSKKINTQAANTVAGSENKIDFDFVKNQKSLYFNY